MGRRCSFPTIALSPSPTVRFRSWAQAMLTANLLLLRSGSIGDRPISLVGTEGTPWYSSRNCGQARFDDGIGRHSSRIVASFASTSLAGPRETATWQLGTPFGRA